MGNLAMAAGVATAPPPIAITPTIPTATATIANTQNTLLSNGINNLEHQNIPKPTEQSSQKKRSRENEGKQRKRQNVQRVESKTITLTPLQNAQMKNRFLPTKLPKNAKFTNEGTLIVPYDDA